MRLSDAIALGRTLIRPNDGTHTLRGDGSGCACGMALAAMGEKTGNIRTFRAYWPQHGLWTDISNRYNQVVRGEMTLDQLIDWVRSIEPAEEETPVAVKDEQRRVLVSSR